VLYHSSQTILYPKRSLKQFLNQSRTRRRYGTISASPINTAVPSCRNTLTEYVKGDGRRFEHFSLLNKVFTLPVFVLS